FSMHLCRQLPCTHTCMQCCVFIHTCVHTFNLPPFQVEVFEEKSIVGGACRTEYPFAKVPGLGHSTGAYLLGV
ncbi:hypothetical protein COO60DRAFT_1522022, partial [Scenedesmus sp. NREL 46B-D3]